jgi:segregation and condensation protein B
VIGRPILYKTTREFLLRFGLKDVSELPSMEEFEKMAAAELEEPEAASGPEDRQGSESGSAAQTRVEGEPEFELSTAEDPIAEPSNIAE